MPASTCRRGRTAWSYDLRWGDPWPGLGVVRLVSAYLLRAPAPPAGGAARRVSVAATSWKTVALKLGAVPVVWAVSSVAVVSIVAQSFSSGVLTGPTSSTSLQASRPSSVWPSGPISMDQFPGTSDVNIRFAPFTSAATVQGWGDQYGLDMVGYSPAFGRSTFSLPRVTISQLTSDTALVTFPPLAQSNDVSTFIADNHLSVIRWVREPRADAIANERVALVQLPKLNLRRLDPAAGTWAAQLPAHLDVERVKSWAQGAGLRYISYDQNTGETHVYAPGTAVQPYAPAAAAAIALLRQRLQDALSKIHPIAASHSVPGGLRVTAGSSGILMTWSAAQGASAYAIYRGTSVNGPYSYIGQTTTLSFSDSSGTSGTLFYRVMSLRACAASVTDRGGCQTASPPLDTRYASAPSAVVSIPQSGTSPAGAPSGLTGVSASPGARLTWNSVTGATAYAIFSSPTSGGAYTYIGQTTTTGFTDTAAPDGATSYYRVMAMHTCPAGTTDLGGCQASQPSFDPRYATVPLPVAVPASGGTTTGGGTTPPPAQVMVQATASAGHVTLTWTAVPGASAYHVFRSAAGGQAVAVGTTTDTSLVDTGGQAGGSYSYEVDPDMPAGSPAVTPATATAVWQAASSKPTVTTMEPSTGTLTGSAQLTLRGRSGDGAAVVTWLIGGNGGWTPIGTVTAQRAGGDPLAWTSTLTWNTTAVGDGAVSLRATAADGSGNTTQADQTYEIVNGRPPAPTAFAATPEAGAIALSWQQPSYTDAASYALYRDETADPLAVLNSDARSYVDAQPSPGQHTYRLVMRGSPGQLSDTVAASAAVLSGMAAPTVIDFQAKLPTGADLDSEATVSSRLLLTAKIAPSGALVFEYQIDGGVWTQVDATTVCQTGQCDADWDTALLPPGHYKVRGRAGSTTSNGHGFHRGAPSVPLAPSGNSVSMARGGVLIRWSAPAASEPVAYSVWRRTGVSWQLLARVAGREFLDNAYLPGIATDYRIEAINSDGQEGAPSPTAHITPLAQAAAAPAAGVGTPHGLAALSAPGAVTLYWIAATNAHGYSIERALATGGPFAIVATTSETSFVDRPGPIGGQAYYQARATSGSQTSEASSAVPAVLIPVAAVYVNSSKLSVATGAAPSLVLAKPEILLGGTDGSPPNASTLVGRAVQTTVQGTSTANISAARIETQTLGGSWQPLAVLVAVTTGSGWTAIGDVVTAGLPAGTYSVRAVAIAPNGSTVDTTATRQLDVVHSVPAPVALDPQIDGSDVLLSWTAPVTSTAVAYSVYRSVGTSGFVQIASDVTGTTYRDSYLGNATAMRYRVSAVDLVGNSSPMSQAASITTPLAWDAPSIMLISPLPAEAAALESAILEIEARTSARAGVASVTMSYMPSGGTAWIGLPALPLPSSVGGGASLNLQGGTIWSAGCKNSALHGNYSVRLDVTDSRGRTSEQITTSTFIGSAPRGPPLVNLTITPLLGGLRLTWPADGVNYQVRRSANGTSGVVRSIGRSSSGSLDDTDVVPGLTYAYQLWTLGGPASRSVTASASSGSGVGVVTPQAGGSASSADGKATVTIAPGMVNSSIAVFVKAAAGQASLAYDLSAIDAEGAAVHNFNGLPMLTIHYPTSGVAPAAIYYLGPDGRSLPLTSSVNTTAHTISAPLPHFSTYVAGLPAAIDLVADPSTPVAAGTSVTLTATVTDASNNAVEQAPVTFTSDGGSTLDQASCTTDAGGHCSVHVSDAAFEVVNATATVDSLSKTVSVTFQQDWAVALANGTGHNVSLTASGSDVSITVDGSPSTRPAATISSLTVSGGDGDDVFSVDASTSSLAFPITFAGAGGNDTIEGPDADSKWTLTGVNAGKLAFGTTAVSFTDTENIQGGTAKNAYTYGDSAGVTGSITNATGSN